MKMVVPLKALGINSKDENEMMGLGWLHELPDIRDYSVETEAVSMILKPLKLSKISPSTLPAAVDLRNLFSPIENQQSIGSCTAHAGVGLVEYFERKAFGTHIDASRLFLYKVTRNLLQVAGDA
jgi:C1A family cysteine protease